MVIALQGHLRHTARFNIVSAVPIDTQPQLPRLSVHHTPHAVGTAQRLVLLQAVPTVNSDPIVPPDSEIWQPRILRRELKCSHLLEWILLWVPFNTNIVHRLLVQILQHLGAEGVGHSVVLVELLELVRKNIDRVVCLDLDTLIGDLFLTEWENAVLGNVFAVAVGRLRVFGHGVH